MSYVAIQHLLRDDCRLGGQHRPSELGKDPAPAEHTWPTGSDRLSPRLNELHSTRHSRPGGRSRFSRADVGGPTPSLGGQGRRGRAAAMAPGQVARLARHPPALSWLAARTGLADAIDRRDGCRAGRAVFHAVPHRHAQLPAVPRAVAGPVDFSRRDGRTRGAPASPRQRA